MSTASPTGASFDPLAKAGDLEAFRSEIRRWISVTIAEDWQQKMPSMDEQGVIAFYQWWFTALNSAGLATAHWPKEWGGRGLSLTHQVIIFEELARANAPMPELHVISLYHVPATLFAHGNQQQRTRYLNGVKERGEVWCQGFSEPGAGSDLASLRTRAERRTTADGRDVYIVNGQKIWSSFGMHADYYLLLARTDPSAPKKQMGISCFIMDLASPGVTIRPIRQMTGEQEFTEVFLDNVEIPAENLIGAENAGWSIAQSTLSAERGLIIFESTERMASAFAREFNAGRDSWCKDDELRRVFMGLFAELRALRELIRQLLSAIEQDPANGGNLIAPYVKLLYATLLQRFNDFLLRIGGIEGQQLERPVGGLGHHSGHRMLDYLRSFSWTIAGGTNEIMRNLIAERILELPR